MKLARVLLPALLFAVCWANAFGQRRSAGTVTELIDGKTVTVSWPAGKTRVELQYIDVPEASQPLYETVREHLKLLVVGKTVEFRLRRFEGSRATGEILSNGVDISEQMLRDGAAWHLPRERSGQDAAGFGVYAAAEALAKQEKRGIWSIDNLKPSWQLRDDLAEQQRLEDQIAWTKAYEKRIARVRPDSASRNSGKNVGALLSKYDERSKSGYVATPFFGVTGSEDFSKQLTLAVSFSYTYVDGVVKGKKVTKDRYAIHIANRSLERWRFIKTSGLYGFADGYSFFIGKPMHIERGAGGEVWTYDISRSTIDKMINGSEVYFRSGTFLIIPTTGLQMLLYNLLHSAE
jgi:endonuclease YncB( thermonuclease family)